MAIPSSSTTAADLLQAVDAVARAKADARDIMAGIESMGAVLKQIAQVIGPQRVV